MRAEENGQIEEKKKKQPHSRWGWFLYGLRNGIPICMGYFAVSFALGIAARNAGMDAAQSFVMSLTMVASAGQFAAINLIASGAGVIEMITTSVIVNLRYFLMSCSLTQKLKADSGLQHRFLLAYCMTDEIFGLSVSVDGTLEPWYTYGITIVSVSGWCAGTVLGVLMGNILPVWASNALGVAMYGMFLAIIIPPAKKEHFIGGLVAVSMFASWLFTVLPGLKQISSGFRVIILTIVIAGVAAAVRPHDEEPEPERDEGCYRDHDDEEDESRKEDHDHEEDQDDEKVHHNRLAKGEDVQAASPASNMHTSTMRNGGDR